MFDDAALLRHVGANAAETNARQCYRQRDDRPPPHTPLPAKPGVTAGGRGPDPRRSIFLYHESRWAAATMMAMPPTLTAIWTTSRSDRAVNTKWPANERN